MFDILKRLGIKAPVTLPLRACLAARSIPEITEFLELVDQDGSFPTTITIWSSVQDKVDLDQLDNLISQVGKNRWALKALMNFVCLWQSHATIRTAVIQQPYQWDLTPVQLILFQTLLGCSLGSWCWRWTFKFINNLPQLNSCVSLGFFNKMEILKLNARRCMQYNPSSQFLLPVIVSLI